MRIEQNIPLGPLTTFKIGGNAKWYSRVDNIEDLKLVVGYANAKNLKIFILGAGSNILISDEGFDGLVIHPQFKGINFDVIKDRGECVAYAGEGWDDVVSKCVDNNLSGIENLSLIPGTVGGAVVQNIGAYGIELENILYWVDAFDMKTGNIERFRNKDCNFEYRNSFFKSREGRNFLIIKASFILDRKFEPNIDYKDLSVYFSEKSINNPSLSDVRNAVINIRNSKMPDLSVMGTAGSFFKNPVIKRDHVDVLLKKYPNLPNFEFQSGFHKISAAWIIDNICKLRGYREGDAGIFGGHALVLVNHGKASSKDIDKLVQKITKDVYESTDIVLEKEVEYVP